MAGHVKSMSNTEVLARLGMAPIWVEARMRRLSLLRPAAARSDNPALATVTRRRWTQRQGVAWRAPTRVSCKLRRTLLASGMSEDGVALHDA